MNKSCFLILALCMGVIAHAQSGGVVKVRGLTTKDSIDFAKRIDSIRAQIAATAGGGGSNSAIAVLTAASSVTLPALRALANPQTTAIYQTTDGRQWYYDSTDLASADNTGTVLVTANGKRLKLIYDASRGMNIEWFGGKGDSVTDVRTAFVNAINALPAEGGTILFPKGKFMTASSSGFFIGRSNVTIKGQGIGKTWLVATAQSSGLQPSVYRSGNWLADSSQMITYKDSSLGIGQGWVDLKNIADTALLPAGTKFFLNAGSSGYDPYYGEFNIVDKIVGNRLYLRYALARDYTVAAEAWNATTSRDFTLPAGTTDTLTLIGQIPVIGVKAISLNNDLYDLRAVSGNTVTLYNPGNKSNSASLIPAGAKVTKWRAIALTPQSSYNTTIEDLTIETKGGTTIVVSNSIKTTLNRVEILNSTPSGAWIDGDDGRDFRMDNCYVRSGDGNPVWSQFARSFCNISMTNSTLTQAQFQYSEYNNSIDILHNNFFFHGGNGINPLARMAPITAGWSCSNARIRDNHITASDCDAAIGGTDILNVRGNSATAIDISNNTFDLHNVGTAIAYGYQGGHLSIDHNTFSGDVGILFYQDIFLPDDNTLQYYHGGFSFGASYAITNNTFAGYIDAFDKYNSFETITGNTIIKWGNHTPPGGDPEYNGHGNVIYSRATTDTSAYRYFVFRDNTFIGWDYKVNSINIPTPQDETIDVRNNRFIQQTGTFRPENSFTYAIGSTSQPVMITNTLQTTEGQTFQTTEGETIIFN